jgi:hypothetical protein
VEPQERYDEIADDLVARNDDVELARMMGMPCVNRAGKMVAGFTASAGAMVFKLPDPDQRDAALALEGAQLFDPSGQGRPFKEWVQVPAAHADRWPEFAEAALVMPSG